MEKMLEFGQEYVGSKILSENNAILYRLAVKGTNRSSTNKPSIKLNDVEYDLQYKDGLNFIVLNIDNTIKEQKSFDVSNESMIPALKEYINSFTTELFIAYSYNEIVTSKAFEDLLKSYGGVQWNHKLLTRYPVSSYASIFRSDIKKIVLEGICFTNEDQPESDVDLECVYDHFSDIGITGFTKPIVQDYTSYTSDKQIIKQLPENTKLVFKLKDYGLKAGDWVLFSGALQGSQELKEAGGYIRSDCRWVTGSTWGESIFIEQDLVDEEIISTDFEYKYTYGQIPPTADGFIIITSKQNEKGTAKGTVKNITLSLAAEPSDYTMPRQVSVNGIRSNEFIQENFKVEYEGTSYNSLLSLQNGSDKTVSTDFREY